MRYLAVVMVLKERERCKMQEPDDNNDDLMKEAVRGATESV
jgi:hypothetical protein